MERDQLKELHYITHIDNVASICRAGVLSHRRAARLGHKSVADPEVQERRKRKRVPSGLLLHDYANLYITARNPMLFKCIEDGCVDELCVIAISVQALDQEGVVVTDRNAAKFGCRFMGVAEGIEGVDADLLNRTYWNDGNALERERCWNTKFTEVLVPNQVEPKYLRGIYVGTSAGRAALGSLGESLPIQKKTRLFFDRS